MKRLCEPLIVLASASILLVVVVAWLRLGMPVGAMLLAVFIGWWHVLARVMSLVEVSVGGVVTGILCAVMAIVALHSFARWLYAEARIKKGRDDWPAAWRWSWSVGLCAVVGMMFIAGLAGVGLFRTTSWFLETPQFVTRANDFR
jgi:hypothetical protein